MRCPQPVPLQHPETPPLSEIIHRIKGSEISPWLERLAQDQRSWIHVLVLLSVHCVNELLPYNSYLLLLQQDSSLGSQTNMMPLNAHVEQSINEMYLYLHVSISSSSTTLSGSSSSLLINPISDRETTTKIIPLMSNSRRTCVFLLATSCYKLCVCMLTASQCRTCFHR